MPKVRLYSNRLLLVLFAFLAASLCIFIFCMSSESAAVSGEKSTSIVKAIVRFLVPDLDKRVPLAEQPAFFSLLDHCFRKTIHFSLFAILGILLFFISAYFERTWRAHCGTALGAAALYAAFDEFHQAFSPGRGPGFSDVLLDSAGAAFGIFIVCLVSFRMVKSRKNNIEKQQRAVRISRGARQRHGGDSR